jgi:hypothetical protein
MAVLLLPSAEGTRTLAFKGEGEQMSYELFAPSSQ